MVKRRTILLTSYYGHQYDLTGSGTVTPGMLLERDSNNKVKAHATDGVVHQFLFACEDDSQLVTADGGGIDTDYSDGDRVHCVVPLPGDRVFALLSEDSSGESAVSIGEALTSNGAGSLRKADTGDDIVAIALEAADNTDSSAGDWVRRIKVEIAS